MAAHGKSRRRIVRSAKQKGSISRAKIRSVIKKVKRNAARLPRKPG